jgi:hypothetical protein
MISQVDAEQAKTWARRKRSQARWATLDFPVVIELPTDEVAYRTDTPLWGFAYFPLLRRVVARDIAVPAAAKQGRR